MGRDHPRSIPLTAGDALGADQNSAGSTTCGRSFAWAVGSWVRSLRHDRLGGCGKVQYELAFVLVQPYLSLRLGAAGELARFAIVETPAAVADPDFPGPRPLSGEAGAHRDAQLGGADRGVGISCYHQRACTCILRWVRAAVPL